MYVSTSQCTVLWLCVTVPNCFLQSVHWLKVPHNLPSVNSLSLCPLLISTVGPLSVSTSQCTVCFFHISMFNFVFYSMSIVYQYHIFYLLLVLCHCAHCSLLQYVHRPSVPNNLASVGSASLCALLCFRVCPLSVNTSKSTFCWFCVTITIAAFCSLSTVSQYSILYCLLVLCHYVHCCLVHSFQCLSVPHNLTLLVLCHHV